MIRTNENVESNGRGGGEIRAGIDGCIKRRGCGEKNGGEDRNKKM